MKKYLSVLLSVILILSAVGFSAAAKAQINIGQIQETDENKLFNKDKAIKAALTAAKARFATEGVSLSVSSEAIVTKVRYDADKNSYSVTVRAQRIYKYECDISVRNVFGTELGMPENSQYTEQGKVRAFFGQLFEKAAYFFIGIFGKDEP